MKMLRVLLLPVSLLYGVIIYVRNLLFDKNILKSSAFNIPVISVGNLSMGGTGKTPQMEYLIRLLQGKYKIATLSRGYGRKSKGFLLASESSTAKEIGDEPKQLKQKFTNIEVAVDENRTSGIQTLLKQFPSTKAILLDDAFQHRKVKAGLSILLTDYTQPYFDDWVVPSGTLREFKGGAKRADIIIVSKCPENISSAEKEKIRLALKPTKHQIVLFSYIGYGNCTRLFEQSENICSPEDLINLNCEVLLLTGIANPSPLKNFIATLTSEIHLLTYSDHHAYTAKDIETIKMRFKEISNENKVLITTEKDATRLSPFKKELAALPIYTIGIETQFNKEDKQQLNALILNYVKKN